MSLTATKSRDFDAQQGSHVNISSVAALYSLHHGASQSRATHFPNTALLYSME